MVVSLATYEENNTTVIHEESVILSVILTLPHISA